MDLYVRMLCGLPFLLFLTPSLPHPSPLLFSLITPHPLTPHKDHPTLIEGLDLVQEEDQITHLLSLAEDYDGEDILNVFQTDDDYLANEEKYREIKTGWYT